MVEEFVLLDMWAKKLYQLLIILIKNMHNGIYLMGLEMSPYVCSIHPLYFLRSGSRKVLSIRGRSPRCAQLVGGRVNGNIPKQSMKYQLSVHPVIRLKHIISLVNQ